MHTRLLSSIVSSMIYLAISSAWSRFMAVRREMVVLITLIKTSSIQHFYTRTSITHSLQTTPKRNRKHVRFGHFLDNLSSIESCSTTSASERVEKYVSTSRCTDNSLSFLSVQEHHCYAPSIQVSYMHNYVNEMDGCWTSRKTTFRVWVFPLPGETYRTDHMMRL